MKLAEITDDNTLKGFDHYLLIKKIIYPSLVPESRIVLKSMRICIFLYQMLLYLLQRRHNSRSNIMGESLKNK